MLPDLKISMSSALNRAECISRLDNNLCQWSPHLGNKRKVFMGERFGDEFKFSQARQLGNSFQPIATGRFEEEAGRTNIVISFRMHAMVMLFLSIFVGFLFLMFINLLLELHIGALFIIFFLLAPLGLIYIGFYLQIPKFRNRIAHILEGH